MIVSGIARSSKVVEHSPLKEFVDPTRKKICLLDDNFFGFAGRKDLLLELQATGKPFVFKQGLDVRLLDVERAEILFASRYDGNCRQCEHGRARCVARSDSNGNYSGR